MRAGSLLKVALDEADLHQEKNKLLFGGQTFFVMGLFGEHANRLAAYVGEPGAAD